MTDPDKSNWQSKTTAGMRFSTEPQADPPASTDYPGLTPGADYQPSEQRRHAVHLETPRDDALMRRYNR